MSSTDLSRKTPIDVALADLCIAPENIRASQPADDGIPALAASLMATGQILPLHVRATPDLTKPWGVLAGRRRLQAFWHNEELGLIDGRHLVRVIICETPEEIAAASVVMDAEREPISHADTLWGVHHLIAAGHSIDDMARILAKSVKQTRQLARLGSLDKRFLDAYRAQQLTLPTLRRLARVTDPNAIDDLAAQLTRNGTVLDHTITTAADRGKLHADSPLARLVGLEAYTKDGGTIEQDLFDEVPDMITDLPRLHRLWVAKVSPILDALREEKLIGVSANPDAMFTDMARMPSGWAPPAANADAIKAALDDIEDWGRMARRRREEDDAGWIDDAVQWARHFLTFSRLFAEPLTVTGAHLTAAEDGLHLTFYVDADELAAHDLAQKAATTPPPAPSFTGRGDPEGVGGALSSSLPVVIDTANTSHTLHEKLTRLAGHGLAAALADHPDVAVLLQTAAQFKQILVDPTDDRLLRLTTSGRLTQPEDGLRDVLTERLLGYRDAWSKTGLPVFTWIAELEGTQQDELLALLTAYQLDTTEHRTDAIRPQTRHEAALVAQAIDYKVGSIWLPDADFYKDFSKKQLLAFVVDMDAVDSTSREHAKLSHDDLVALVAQSAKARNWVPPQLQFTVTPAAPPAVIREIDGVTERADGTIIYRIKFNSAGSPIYPKTFQWRTDGEYAHVEAGGNWNDDDLFETEQDFLDSLVTQPVPDGWTRLIAFLPNPEAGQ